MEVKWRHEMSFRFYHKWLVTLSHVKPCNYIVYFSFFPFSKHILISLTPCRQIYLSALTMQTTEECIPYVLKAGIPQDTILPPELHRLFSEKPAMELCWKGLTSLNWGHGMKSQCLPILLTIFVKVQKLAGPGAVVGGLRIISQLRKSPSPGWKHLLALPHLRH